MPNALIRSYAKKSGKSVDEVEKMWEQAKAEAHSKFATEDGHFWAYANATVSKMLGMKEHYTFKKHLGKESRDE